MDLDDLEVAAPSKVPARVSKFAPKSAKFNPKPKPEPAPEPERETQSSLSKSELEEATESTHAKPEPDGTVKVDLEPKSEAEEESIRDDPMDEDGSEDTVVREIDVLFTPSIDTDTQLYILQYSLRPSWRPYDLDELCEEIKLNLGSSHVEIDLPIDLESSNIDKAFANKHNVKKQTLSTSWKPTRANSCVVGLLLGDKLHLHPIHAVVQLRPSLQHLNSVCSKRENMISTGANAAVKTEGSAEVKYVATSKKQLQNEPTETSVQQKSDDDEQWVPLKYHSCKSDISSGYLQKMAAQESSLINFGMNAYDYITSLCPGVNSNMLPKGLSKRHLEKLPVEERLKKILTEGCPLLRFSAIKHYASEYSEEELLGFLQQHAILVQGLWGVKSSVLFNSNSENRDKEHDKMVALKSLARDYVLLLFTKNLKVQISHVNTQDKLTRQVEMFLNVFGSKGYDISKSGEPIKLYWKFREVPDDTFKKLYPNVVEKQEEIFKIMEQKVFERIGKPTRKDSVANRSVNNELAKSAKPDQRVTSLGGVPSGRLTMSNETRRALPIALKKLFQTHKVCSFQMICQVLRDLILKGSFVKGDSKIASDAALCVGDPHDELKAVISEVACHIHGYYVLKSSPNDPFRDVVIEMLRESGPNPKLKKAEILNAAWIKLNRKVTNSEYTKVMSELCVSRGSVWVFEEK